MSAPRGARTKGAAMPDWLTAIVLGLVEGLTEFIPVSSTGHLLLTKTLLVSLGLTADKWNVFIVLIQLGPILAVVLLYFQRLWMVALRIPTHPKALRFVVSLLFPFLPAAAVRCVFH